MKTPTALKTPARGARVDSQSIGSSNTAVRIAALLLIIWTLVYAIVCFRFISKDSVDISPQVPILNNIYRKIAPEFAALKISEAIDTPAHMPKKDKDDAVQQLSPLTNPFLSNVCVSTFAGLSSGLRTVSVIIPVRNEIAADLVATINSVAINSGNYVGEVIIVDDASKESIGTDKEWEGLRSALAPATLVIHKSIKHLGVAGAKAIGADLAKGQYLVFLDAHTIVSPNWLAPLVESLKKTPNSIVYPAIDIIDGAVASGKLIQGDDAVGAFDWSLRFRWEFVEQTDRVPLAAGRRANDDEILSPAAPGIFAIQTEYLNKLGGFDRNLLQFGTETIELSLRVWLCGGVVIRQPCSRVAHSYPNLFNDVINSGATVGAHDRNAMLISDRWMSTQWREIVYQGLFIGRVPYPIHLSHDSRMPRQLHLAAAVGAVRDTCQSFDWYLKEIFPGLLVDAPHVSSEYSKHLASGYLEEALKPLLEQYNSDGQGHVRPIPSAPVIPQKEIPAPELPWPEISKPEIKPAHISQVAAHIPEKVPLTKPGQADRNKAHEKHVEIVKETLLCEDEVLPGAEVFQACGNRAMLGDCKSHPDYMMFGCPKSCGFCVNDKLCVDFFLQKCPQYVNEKGCNDPWMKKHCMKTCNNCGNENSGSVMSQKIDSSRVVPAVIPSVPADGQIFVHGIPVAPRVDPTKLHLRWLNGEIADPSPKDPCKIKNGPNGKLLDRVHVTTENELKPVSGSFSDVKIFCATYTMEANHKGNVNTMRSTWTKRCDGFVAFSTAADPDIPAIKIEHEGEESYDNMWQKSRSIWRYVGTHYINEFDWFLIGGDDMYYIVENLRHYLGSSEIQSQSSEKPMFIGRRFTPPGQKVFNSGGAGYLLNREALSVLMDNIDTNQKCWLHQKGFWEDVNVANCLFQGAGILPYDTRDELKRERFHPFTPGQHLEYRAPPDGNDWYVKYNPELKFGFDCCSDRSISFHYAKSDVMENLHSYLYHCSSKPKI